MKRGKKIALIVLAVVVLAAGGMFLMVTDGLEEAKNVQIGSADASGIADGVYAGSYDFKRWSASVTVTVRDEEITEIELTDDVRMAQLTDCFEETASKVLAKQNTEVDAVTGATATSKAYLKAIENALENARSGS